MGKNRNNFMSKAAWFLIGIVCLGIVLVIIPVFKPDLAWLNSIGGAFLGAGIGVGLGRLASLDLQDVLESSIDRLGIGFTSKPKQIEDFLPRDSKLHLYHITQIRDERLGAPAVKNLWQHTILDFSKSNSMDKLTCTAQWPHPSKSITIDYETELGLRGTRVVMIMTPEKKQHEAPPILLFETSGTGRDCLSGIVFHQTLDSNHSINAAIYTNAPLFPDEPEGTVADETEDEVKFKKYSLKWKNELIPEYAKIFAGTHYDPTTEENDKQS
jgi:hypothetical protein